MRRGLQSGGERHPEAHRPEPPMQILSPAPCEARENPGRGGPQKSPLHTPLPDPPLLRARMVRSQGAGVQGQQLQVANGIATDLARFAGRTLRAA